MAHCSHRLRWCPVAGKPRVMHLNMKSYPSACCTQRDEARESIYDSAAAAHGRLLAQRASVQEEERSGGGASVGYHMHRANGGWRIGVMVAANSGRPGGACGGVPGLVLSKVHPGHRTQEEDMVSNWLITEQPTVSGRERLFANTLKGTWGMSTVASTSAATLQGVDYVHAEDPSVYADAWVVSGARLSDKSGAGAGARFLTDRSFPAALVFAAGPNASMGRSATGSMRRTRNVLASASYDFFEQCLKESLRASFDAMVAQGVTAAVVSKTSCGVYAGPHKTSINQRFKDIVDERLYASVVHAPRIVELSK